MNERGDWLLFVKIYIKFQFVNHILSNVIFSSHTRAFAHTEWVHVIVLGHIVWLSFEKKTHPHINLHKSEFIAHEKLFFSPIFSRINENEKKELK